MVHHRSFTFCTTFSLALLGRCVHAAHGASGPQDVTSTAAGLSFTARSLQATSASSADTCLITETAAATVNSSVQLQAEQPVNNTAVQQELSAGLAEYLRIAACNIQLSFHASTACPVAASANSSSSCSNGNYICRGVTQVSQSVYNAVQNDSCTTDSSGTSFTCLGSPLDLTTYLSIQQGQCCLQCPGQPDCATEASQLSVAPAQSQLPSYECGNYSIGVAVGDSLDSSSVQDLLETAISGGLLQLYVQTAGLSDATVLSVGPTSKPESALVLVMSPLTHPSQLSRLCLLIGMSQVSHGGIYCTLQACTCCSMLSQSRPKNGG